jgi:hypothetical protein
VANGRRFGLKIACATSGAGYFRAKLSPLATQTFSNLVIHHLPAYEDGTDSVPKRRHIKFKRRGITQKKTYKYRVHLCLLYICVKIDPLYERKG